MAEQLLSVGLDVGTTSTQLVVSELKIENRASGFAVPELEIAERKIRYQSPVYFTPLLSEQLVDGDGIRTIVEAEYERAGIRREDVDTGAIIITGETSRKENARAVLEAMSDLAGDFVVATAGPHLESVLAAKGAGADAYSEETGKTVLHMDIGGGTSNLALLRDGKIVQTGCLNVGGRLVKLNETGVVTYVSPVLEGLWNRKVGDKITVSQAEELAAMLVQALEMAAGLRERTELLEKLTTAEAGSWCAAGSAGEVQDIAVPLPTRRILASLGRATFSPGEGAEMVLSFSGGVADCIEKDVPWLTFGDIGPVLGRALRKSRLCQGEYRLGNQIIRATVIGAGCHSAQLSGSTVFCQNVTLPLKNLPVVSPEEENREGVSVLALAGVNSPSYAQVQAMAEEIAAAGNRQPVLVCLEQDMAKALGQALALRLGKDAQILCIDRIKPEAHSYLDIGTPLGPTFPVVVKTLVLGR